MTANIMNYTGIIIAASTFLIIGIFHPLVIRVEYHFGVKAWRAFLVIGVAACVAALFIANVVLSAIVGVVGAASLWSIEELFKQKKRVEKGWFPMNPRRKDEYR
ncbi:MAG: DUF4491 family protein [Prevotella sp.]|nr:DUF4491 family protein [Prevotella sp.]